MAESNRVAAGEFSGNVDFSGKSVLVTGAGKGIGRAIARMARAARRVCRRCQPDRRGSENACRRDRLPDR